MGVAPEDVQLTVTAMKTNVITMLPTPVSSITMLLTPVSSVIPTAGPAMNIVCAGLAPLFQLDASHEAV